MLAAAFISNAQLLEPLGGPVSGAIRVWGSAFALIVWNLLFRIGFSGDKEREKEEAARRYLMEHGHWPDEK